MNQEVKMNVFPIPDISALGISEQVNLLSIPEEVIEGHMLKYLSWNDLLRLRRVCKSTKHITDGYIQVNYSRAPQIEISEESGRTVKEFMEMGIPTTKVYLRNPSGYRFYEDMDKRYTRIFIEQYGSVIKHVRVNKISLWPQNEELHFLSSLPNIESFEADSFSWGKGTKSRREKEHLIKRVMDNSNDITSHKNVLPTIFKDLKHLRISQDPDNFLINRLYITHIILQQCQKLQTACLPFTLKPLLNIENYSEILPGKFAAIETYIYDRPNDLYSEMGCLRCYDFDNCHDNIGGWDKEKTEKLVLHHWRASHFFLILCEVALRTGVCFENVSPYWFSARDSDDDGRLNSPEFGIPIVSVRGYHPQMRTLLMPNLENIIIPFTSRCVGILPNEEKPDWPALKYLDVTVDDINSFAWDYKLSVSLICAAYNYYPYKCLYSLLFEDIVRGNMIDLKFKFFEGRSWTDLEKKIVVPNIGHIMNSCPHLKQITLGNWLGTNKALLKLWEGLPELEEITFENCKNVGNVTFVGLDSKNPVFLKLKNLKKLALRGLDEMPKITDLLFTMVLAQMNLKELILTSEKPVKMVTKVGVTALLKGPFSETIEKFSFKEWSLAGVHAKEFQNIGMQFRSDKMI